MIVEDTTFDIGATGDVASVDYDYGFDAGGFVGYDFGPVRIEAEARYAEANIDQVTVGNTGFLASNIRAGSGVYPASGQIDSLAFMVNGLADFGPDDGLQGFVGGGVGVARTGLEARITRSGPAGIDDSDTDFAWQILAGVRAPLTDNIDVGLKYRLFNAENVLLTDALGRSFQEDVRSHSLMGTLTYNFGAPDVVAPPPPPPHLNNPAPPPPPPPPPAPACESGPYIVFFNWDKSDITPEAASILDNAVSAYANCGMASVMLAGYTDTSGSAQYNVGLSERRNASVRDYLTARGVPGGRITSEGFGETNLRVPTADGVRELQNRRVEITYGPGSGM